MLQLANYGKKGKGSVMNWIYNKQRIQIIEIPES